MFVHLEDRKLRDAPARGFKANPLSRTFLTGWGEVEVEPFTWNVPAGQHGEGYSSEEDCLSDLSDFGEEGEHG